MRQWINMWQAIAILRFACFSTGIESTISKSFSEDGRFYFIYEKLIYKRNRNMALRIEGFLGTNGTYFVVVGAAHLLGDRGIIQLLREKWYTVEQL